MKQLTWWRMHGAVVVTTSMTSTMSMGGCQGAGCISREPLDGFCSFFAGKLIWQSRVDSQKFTTLGSISWILEGCCITMATLSDFFKIWNREDALWPRQPLPTKFQPDWSRNSAGAGGRGHKPYCFYSMIHWTALPKQGDLEAVFDADCTEKKKENYFVVCNSALYGAPFWCHPMSDCCFDLM